MTAAGVERPDRSRRAARGVACPLCGCERSVPAGWPGRLRYRGGHFSYLECRACGSLHCDPMPSEEHLAQMYGPDYAAAAGAAFEVATTRDVPRVLAILDGRETGTFVDFGCGDGELLRLAQDRGWRCLGVELDPGVAGEVSRRLGIEVRTYDEVAAEPLSVGDVVHAGDVLEHLPELGRQLPVLLSLVNHGGLVVAQGPLEANANVFTALVRSWGRLRPRREKDLPPWHVLLATAAGQRALFRRFDLEELTFTVSEVDWPAPSRLGAAELSHPRAVALFCARRVSSAVTRIGPAGWGNRYFYVGRRPSARRVVRFGGDGSDGSTLCAG